MLILDKQTKKKGGKQTMSIFLQALYDKMINIFGDDYVDLRGREKLWIK